MFPIVLASMSDATVALNRISSFLTAEELAEPYTIDYEHKNAVDVDGDFTWEEVTIGGKDDPEKVEQKGKTKEPGRHRGRTSGKEPVLPITTSKTQLDDINDLEQEPKPESKPFELRHLKLSVARGSFVAIVGRVGSGKVIRPLQNLTPIADQVQMLQSSILQALIGEMRRTRGQVNKLSFFNLKFSSNVRAHLR
jgi:ABC-type multidrug transport system fused ATPase/permease subunit